MCVCVFVCVGVWVCGCVWVCVGVCVCVCVCEEKKTEANGTSRTYTCSEEEDTYTCSVQKHAEDYNEENGGKWHIKNLRFWLQATCGQEATVGVKRDLLQCQKRLITVSKETYYSVKRDLRSVP
jgi:hypothetical protein